MICSECGERVEATASLWLTLSADGWAVYGIGDDEVAIYCANSHPVELTERDRYNLSDFLRDLERRVDAEVPA